MSCRLREMAARMPALRTLTRSEARETAAMMLDVGAHSVEASAGEDHDGEAPIPPAPTDYDASECRPVFVGGKAGIQAAIDCFKAANPSAPEKLT